MTYGEKVDKRVREIRENPGLHRHDFGALHACCLVDGVLDSRLMELHEEVAGLGTNGGVRCDVTSGPCSCGAWH